MVLVASYVNVLVQDNSQDFTLVHGGATALCNALDMCGKEGCRTPTLGAILFKQKRIYAQLITRKLPSLS